MLVQDHQEDLFNQIQSILIHPSLDRSQPDFFTGITFNEFLSRAMKDRRTSLYPHQRYSPLFHILISTVPLPFYHISRHTNHTIPSLPCPKSLSSTRPTPTFPFYSGNTKSLTTTPRKTLQSYSSIPSQPSAPVPDRLMPGSTWDS